MSEGERRQEVFTVLADQGGRISRLETYRESDKEDLKEFNSTMRLVVDGLRKVEISITTMKVERNTLLAVAGFLGATVSWVGKAIVSFMMSGK